MSQWGGSANNVNSINRSIIINVGYQSQAQFTVYWQWAMEEANQAAEDQSRHHGNQQTHGFAREA